MPVRKTRQIGKNIIGSVPSHKLGRMVHFESLLEEAYIHLLEFHPGVVWYEEQPRTIRYRYQQRDRRYTPDFLVHWANSTHVLVECKPTPRLTDAANVAKWSAAQLFCAAKGWRFSVVTDEMLRRFAPLLDNLRFLRGHAHQDLPAPIQEVILRALVTAGGSLSIADLMRRCPALDPITGRTHVLHLLALHVLTADLARPLHLRDTIVTFAGGSSWHEP